jgi:hypothetical protein
MLGPDASGISVCKVVPIIIARAPMTTGIVAITVVVTSVVVIRVVLTLPRVGAP